MLLGLMQTQWNFSPDGKRCGYNYLAAKVVIKSHGFKHKKKLFAKLQKCEKEILSAWEEANPSP